MAYDPTKPISPTNSPEKIEGNIATTPTGVRVDLTTGALISGPITGANLTPEPTVQFQVPQESPVPAVPEFEMTEPEKEVQTGVDEVQRLQEELIGESAFRTGQEQEVGLVEAKKLQRELTNRLNILSSEREAIPLILEEESKGRGRTTGGVAPLQADRLRQNAIQSLAVSAQLQAAQGNVSTALELIDRAVAARFDPIKERIAVKKANLQLIIDSPEYSVADKRRASRQKAAQDAEEKRVATQEAEQKEIWNIGVTATQNGADAETLRKIQNAKTKEEALSLAAMYLQPPKKGDEFQFVPGTEKQPGGVFNKTTGSFTPLVGVPGNNDIENVRTTELTNKVTTLQALPTHRGLNKAVGPSALGRFTPFKADVLTGDVQEFIGSVEQIIDQEFLDKLINVKGRGATFGALTDREGQALRAAATKIGTWRMTDKNGRVTGYNISEKAFVKELKVLEDLTRKAMEQELGFDASLVTADESAELDALLSGELLNE